MWGMYTSTRPRADALAHVRKAHPSETICSFDPATAADRKAATRH